MVFGFESRSRMAIFFALVLVLPLAAAWWPQPAAARDWLVPEQAPTIQAAIDSCVTGDVVVISPGTYTDCIHYSENVYHIAVLIPGVSLRGSTGDPADVILDAGYQGRCLEIRNGTGEITVEGITMRRGKAVSPFGKGGAVFAIFADPVFRSCVFDSNQADFGGGAISASYGTLTVEDCLFTDNRTDGIGAAVQTSRCPATVTGCTIHGCTGSAVHYATDGLTMANTIITGGDGVSLARNLATDPDPDLDCCDFFDNDEDYPEFIAGFLGIDGNISLDPHYCNPLFGDFQLYMVSPCTAENAGDCGQIGVYGAACGFGAVTWVIQPDGSGDYPTIQAAINAAAAGDTIALADGTFSGEGNRDLDYLGKALTIKGLAGDPQLAVIDCQGTAEEPHRAFLFHSGETVTSVLRDVTITGGEIAGDGGAILCQSSPLIENVVFFRNGADRGGAIFADHGDPRITGCTFTENRGDQRAGGVGLLASEAEISDCLFTAQWGYMGSAVFLPDSSSVTLTGCTITGNNSSLDKDCLGVDGNSSLAIRNCLVTFNTRHAVRNYGAGSVSVTGSCVYGNGEGDYDGPIAGAEDHDGNISDDPLYCDSENGDYSLRSDSPCTEENAPNAVRMGAFGTGCPAPPVFTDISANLPESAAVSNGVSWTDLNGDGHADFLVANDGTPNQVLVGDGMGGFSFYDDPMLQLSSLRTTASAWSDFDNDGDLDVYFGNTDLLNMLGSNNGGVFEVDFTENLDHWGTAGRSSWSDYDGDGRPDLFVASPDSTCVLLRGDGQGGFTPVTGGDLADLGGIVTSCWVDFDGDGDQDLHLVKDGEPDLLLENDGVFTDVTADPLGDDGAGRGAAWGDYDNDGRLDLYLVRNEESNLLLCNTGDGDFTTVSAGPVGDDGPGRSGIWGDWDNDGDLDLFLANCGAADRLLRNEGSGRFIDVCDPAFDQPDSSTGAAWADFDQDGDLDLLVAVRGGGTRLLRNDQAGGNHWLRLNLVSNQGRPGCRGARVELTTPGDSVQVRQVGGGGGWLSENELTVHFGLGGAETVSRLEVTWPGGLSRVDSNLAVDQLLVWTEPDSTGEETPVADVPVERLRLLPARPNPFNPATILAFEIPNRRRVSLAVYDVRGRLVRRLLDEVLEPGRHTAIWRGRDGNDHPAAAGVYLVRLKVGEQVVTRGISLVK